jgi:pimeloyl-ACP methyl ester carboxylesterase
MKVRIGGAEIAYDDRGSGPALLLLHAFPLGLAMWEGQAQALSATHRVLRFDARGFGDSSSGNDAFTMERIADDAAALLDAVGIERAVLGGCSMGGYAAFAFARRHPQRLAGLVLQDTRAAADGVEAKANRTTLATRVLAEGPSAAISAFLPRLLGATSQREQPALVSIVREWIQAASPRALANALHALASREDSRQTLSTIRVPALVVVGEEDVLTPPAEADEMAAAIATGRVERIPRAGHLSNLENPQAFDAALRRFLDSLA